MKAPAIFAKIVRQTRGFFQAKPAAFFAAPINEDPARGFGLWAEAVLAGRLEPHAPHVDSIGRLTSPLQFWAAPLVSAHQVGKHGGSASGWRGQELIEALPALRQAGLSMDHMQADRSENTARAFKGRKGLWTSSRPEFGHNMSSSQRPLLHMLIGYDSSHGAGVEAVQGALRAGASPSSKDAFGIPALALCALHPDPDVGGRLWTALVEAGADPDEEFVSDGNIMGGRVCVVSHQASGGRSISPKELALSSFSSIGQTLRRQDAMEQSQALLEHCCALPTPNRAPARL